MLEYLPSSDAKAPIEMAMMLPISQFSFILTVPPLALAFVFEV